MPYPRQNTPGPSTEAQIHFLPAKYLLPMSAPIRYYTAYTLVLNLLITMPS